MISAQDCNSAAFSRMARSVYDLSSELSCSGSVVRAWGPALPGTGRAINCDTQLSCLSKKGEKKEKTLGRTYHPQTFFSFGIFVEKGLGRVFKT